MRNIFSKTLNNPSFSIYFIDFQLVDGPTSIDSLLKICFLPISVSFQKFEKEVLPEFKELSKFLGEGRFFLDSALPLGFYKSAESLVRWAMSGELILHFRNLPCRKAYFYSEKNADTVALHRLNSIEKIMIGSSGHFMMNDNSNEFYPRLGKFLSST